jgi:DNA-binding transcriptional regulator GbsR (MarR family)
MTNSEAAFVERFAQALYGVGMPRMAGRIWAWLLICDPPEQTAADLARELHASRGSISGMARFLESLGLVHRWTRPRDRREHFHVPPGAVSGVMRARMGTTIAIRRLADEGLELLTERPPEDRARLEEVRDLYEFMERELPRLLDRFAQERAPYRPGQGTDMTRKEGAA